MPIFRHLIQRSIEAEAKKQRPPKNVNWVNNINCPKIYSVGYSLDFLGNPSNLSLYFTKKTRISEGFLEYGGA
tara:strand:- start:18 stop:236 length:219 start_codon:yes stop_codon:yes gene_type:complete